MACTHRGARNTGDLPGRPEGQRTHQGVRPRQESEGPIVPQKPGNAGGGKGPWFGHAFRKAKGGRGLAAGLATPERIRKLRGKLYAKAKQDRDYRFYSLIDKVWREDVLAYAWLLCKANGGAPGTDGQTFSDIEAEGLEGWIRKISEEVRTGAYRPSPVRRVKIPKPDGEGRRPLGIPTIRDRVVQTAARIVLEPIFEADLDEAAYGYRPGRSALEAVEKVHRSLIRGQVQVVDADVSAYFDTIPHAGLMRCLARRIADGEMLHLIKMWLKSPVEETDEQGRKNLRGGKGSKRGVPQGGPLSPLLANLYMNRYLKTFRRRGLAQRYGAELVVYADDLVILCGRGAEEVLEITRRWMGVMGLELNEAKTRVLDARRERFCFLGYAFGPFRASRTGRPYLGAAPSPAALRRLKREVRAILHAGNNDPWEEVVAELNRLIKGWNNYFCYGTLGKTRRAVDNFVYDRTLRFLRRRRKLNTRGTRRLPGRVVFGELGVLSSKSLPRKRYAHAMA